MAALARSSRTLFASFSPASWTRPAVFPGLVSFSLSALLELFPPSVLAVPKSKVSHSRKAMRSANKGLKDKQNIVNCPACGAPKLAHHLCQNCYGFLTRMWKSKRKQQNGGDVPDMS